MNSPSLSSQYQFSVIKFDILMMNTSINIRNTNQNNDIL